MKDAVNLAWKLAAVLTGQASEDILDTYDIERAPVVRRMVELSRLAWLGHHANEPVRRRGARRALRLSQYVRPLPRLHRPRGLLATPCHPSQRFDRKRKRRPDRPDGASADGQVLARRKPQLDRFLACHQWLALGFEADPVPHAVPSRPRDPRRSERALHLLQWIGREEPTRPCPCNADDSGFIAWAKKHGVRGVLVRPDRFIAARLNAERRSRGPEPFRSPRPRPPLSARAPENRFSRRNPCCIRPSRPVPGAWSCRARSAPIVKAELAALRSFRAPRSREGREISHRLWAARRLAQRG